MKLFLNKIRQNSAQYRIVSVVIQAQLADDSLSLHSPSRQSLVLSLLRSLVRFSA